ncbi:hypothetical protein NOR_00917 [Metarhizium rileyi]|uniref:Myb/SANT-like domain-containing protein n=1 Tax=Metarhizium rileyi (strain RCEF 4871) TaxID=1649241 RepID=A0A167JLP7_METRR|nr:hypothetical protein NOR_00917 [Metarhizium rileyi RCEF 4871]
MAFREVCKSLVEDMKEKFPDENWTVKMLENKYNYLRSFWKAFRDAAKRSGTTYDTETKKLCMSEQNVDLFRSKYPRYGRAITSQPLLTNDAIDYDEWVEIFSNEAPTGQFITKAHEIEGSVDRQLEADNSQDDFLLESQETIEASIDVFLNEGPSQGNNSADAVSSINESDDNSDIGEASTPQNPPISSQRMPQRLVSRETQPNRLPESLRKRKASSLQADSILAMSEAIHKLAKQPRKYIIISTPTIPQLEGADHLEKACKDAYKLGEEYGLSLTVDVLSWLQKNPRNSVLWNALPTKELKRAWIAANFGEKTEG